MSAFRTVRLPPLANVPADRMRQTNAFVVTRRRCGLLPHYFGHLLVVHDHVQRTTINTDSISDNCTNPTNCTDPNRNGHVTTVRTSSGGLQQLTLLARNCYDDTDVGCR